MAQILHYTHAANGYILYDIIYMYNKNATIQPVSPWLQHWFHKKTKTKLNENI